MMKRLLIALLLLARMCPVLAQQDYTDTLRQRFSDHSVAALHEKVYAQVDRTFYLTGETLWFSIYTVDGTLLRPLQVSKVAYAEVLDRTNFAVLQAKIEVTDGRGHGSFYLPASLSSGNYRLRIYTNWMKNFSPEFFFDQLITIVNPFVIPERSGQEAKASCSIAFFPEGGHLVEDIESKIAYKISGGGEACRGLLFNQENDTLAMFKTSPRGIGHFLFTPRAGERYRALITEADGRTSQHDFPPVQRSGYSMRLNDSLQFLTTTVRTHGVEDHRVFLFIHARQKMVKAEGKQLSQGQASFTINKSDIPDGVTHLTVFNEDLKPVCERLYFTWPKQKLDIAVRTNAPVYRPRQKVSVDIQTGAGESRMPARLSVSVYKDDSLAQQPSLHIFPYLWLASDLTGRIDSLDWYHRQNHSGVGTPTDNLMLTHGWRRFNWDEVLSGQEQFVHIPEVNGHIINGIVTRDAEKQQSILTYLGSPGKIIRTYGSWSNAEGEVRFEIKDFYGPRQLIIQTRTDTSSSYQVTITNPFSTATDQPKLPDLIVEAHRGAALLRRSIAMQVQDIYYYGTYGYQFDTPSVDSSAFYGRADNTYLLDDYTRFPVMEEVMREYVPGVFVRKRRDGFHFLVVDEANGGLLSGDPMVLVDGIPVFDVDDIMKMDPLRVKKLEVIKQQYYLGQAAFSGIVSYSTYNGDLGDLVLDPRSIAMDYEGLQLKRRFFSPQHRGNDDSRMPDQRYLLHWEPEITTNEMGEYRMEFYTSDVAGRYKIVVEGLTDQGIAGTGILTFDVMPADNQ